VLADAVYWHHEQMERIVARGTQVLIPPDSGQCEGNRPGWEGGLYAFVWRVLATDRRGGLYRQRQRLIEPVFAHTRFNRRMERFHRAARTEWRLITAAHSLLKLISTTQPSRPPDNPARDHHPRRRPKVTPPRRTPPQTLCTTASS